MKMENPSELTLTPAIYFLQYLSCFLSQLVNYLFFNFFFLLCLHAARTIANLSTLVAAFIAFVDSQITFCSMQYHERYHKKTSQKQDVLSDTEYVLPRVSELSIMDIPRGRNQRISFKLDRNRLKWQPMNVFDGKIL